MPMRTTGRVAAGRTRLTNLQEMEAKADEAAGLLKTLANSQRLRVLCHLVEKDMTVGEINEHLPELSQSALSQHLSRLRDESLVETRRDAQQIWYHLADGPAVTLIGALHGIYCGKR